MAEINRPELRYQVSVILGKYSKEIAEKVDTLAAASMRRLVRRTKELAPVGRRMTKRKVDQGRPHLFESINSAKKQDALGASVFIWYVQSPNSRIVHLVEHGHAGKNGSRFVAGAHFLEQALNEESPRYEAEIKEAIANGT